MKNIVIIVVAFTAGVILTLFQFKNGDMNHDGRLSITDLSILASIINEQNK